MTFMTGLAEESGAEARQQSSAKDQRNAPTKAAPPAVVGWDVEIITVRGGLDDHAAADQPRKHSLLKRAIGNELDRRLRAYGIVAHEVRCHSAHRDGYSCACQSLPSF